MVSVGLRPCRLAELFPAGVGGPPGRGHRRRCRHITYGLLRQVIA